MNKELLTAYVKEKKDVVSWLADIAQQKHIGDRGLIEALAVSGFATGLGKKATAVHVWVTGEAESGKTHAQETVLEFFPVTDIVRDISSRVPVNRDYKHKSILLIDDEHIGYNALQTLKMFTSPDDSCPVSEIVIDHKVVRKVFPQAVCVWRNSVNLPRDEQIMSRFLLFRTANSHKTVVEFMQQNPQVSAGDWTLAKEVVQFLLTDECTVNIRHKPKVIAKPRKYTFIENLLKAITYANRYSNPTFDAEKRTVEPQLQDYQALLRIVKQSGLLAHNNFDALDQGIYDFVLKNSPNGTSIEEIAEDVGEATQKCRRRLQDMDEIISYRRTEHNKYLFYVSKRVQDEAQLTIPEEVFKVIEVPQ